VLTLVAHYLVDKPCKILLLSLVSKECRTALRDAHELWRQVLINWERKKEQREAMVKAFTRKRGVEYKISGENQEDVLYNAYGKSSIPNFITVL
jgi:hypothetical protein